ncbi:serine hydrolase domain-containing protein [Acidobacteriota bacterium]
MKKIKVFLFLILFLGLLFYSPHISAQGKIKRSHVIELDRILSRFNNQTPGVAVAVDSGGEIIYKRGFGMSNLELNVPIQTDSVFHIASISKQFAAMSVVLLEQQGKLSIDDDIRKYIEEVPDFGETITIRHLANHTSGLRDQWELLGLAGWRQEDLKTNEDVLDLVSRQKALNFKPGEEYLYCNTGYTLLAILVGRVSGKSLREFADENIFKPLGMNHTHFHNDMSEIVIGRTQAYIPGRRGSYRISIPNFNTYGATSLFTTVEDLTLWSRNFFHKKIGGEEGIRRLLTKGLLNNGEKINYALGVSHGEHRGLKTIGHGGADAGYRSNLVIYPTQDLSIVVFANVSNGNPGGLSREVAEVLLAGEFKEERPKPAAQKRPPQPKRPTLSDQQLAEYVGDFYSAELDIVYTIYKKDGSLYLNRRKFPANKLFVRAGDTLIWAGRELAFQRDGNKKITGFLLTRGRVRNLKFVKK